MNTFVGDQEKFEFNSVANRKPVQSKIGLSRTFLAVASHIWRQWRDYGGAKGGTCPPTFFTFSILLIKLITQREL